MKGVPVEGDVVAVPALKTGISFAVQVFLRAVLCAWHGGLMGLGETCGLPTAWLAQFRHKAGEQN